MSTTTTITEIPNAQTSPIKHSSLALPLPAIIVISIFGAIVAFVISYKVYRWCWLRRQRNPLPVLDKNLLDYVIEDGLMTNIDKSPLDEKDSGFFGTGRSSNVGSSLFNGPTNYSTASDLPSPPATADPFDRKTPTPPPLIRPHQRYSSSPGPSTHRHSLNSTTNTSRQPMQTRRTSLYAMSLNSHSRPTSMYALPSQQSVRASNRRSSGAPHSIYSNIEIVTPKPLSRDPSGDLSPPSPTSANRSSGGFGHSRSASDSSAPLTFQRDNKMYMYRTEEENETRESWKKDEEMGRMKGKRTLTRPSSHASLTMSNVNFPFQGSDPASSTATSYREISRGGTSRTTQTTSGSSSNEGELSQTEEWERGRVGWDGRGGSEKYSPLDKFQRRIKRQSAQMSSREEEDSLSREEGAITTREAEWDPLEDGGRGEGVGRGRSVRDKLEDLLNVSVERGSKEEH